ncbi:MAG: HD domain-containing protein [Prolixibacteraceae bacterium]|nr:HD domain-containing protein [Prolixibacteraceae bacterium]
MEESPFILQYNKLFNSYYSAFKGLDPEQDKNFKIKRNHSFRVAQLMLEIAEKSNIEKDLEPLIYAAGLFHDIGRFPQFIKFGTFNDDISTDHAAMSVEVIGTEKFLEGLEKEKEEAIQTAIFYHNKWEVPKNLNENIKILARLLRDADKLDILDVLCDYYENGKKSPNHTLTWEMPDAHKISDEVSKVILQKKQIQKDAVKNQQDIKVYQMSWVYDLNYTASFKMLLKKRYIERIYHTLLKSEKIIEFYRGIKITIENRISS